MIFCPNCGKGIPDESKFCTFCGTPTPLVDPNQPNLATPPPTFRQPVDVSSSTVYNASPKNVFYKNAGFWGAILIGVGTFLPWVTPAGDIFDFTSPNLFDMFGLGFNLSGTSTEAASGVIVWEIALGIILLCALIIVIDSFANFLSSGLAKLIKLLPFIVSVLMLLLLFVGLKDKMDSDQFVDLLQKIGIGIWVTLLGVILLLFYKKTKKIAVKV